MRNFVAAAAFASAFLVLLPAQASSLGSREHLDERFGFKSYVLESPLPPGLTLIEDHGDQKFYDGGEETIGNAPAHLKLCYYKGRLEDIILEVSDEENIYWALKTLEQAYGDPVRDKPPLKNYWWGSRRVDLMFQHNVSTATARIQFESVRLSKEQEADETQRARDDANSL